MKYVSQKFSIYFTIVISLIIFIGPRFVFATNIPPSFSTINTSQNSNSFTANGTVTSTSGSISTVGYQLDSTSGSWTNSTLSNTTNNTVGGIDSSFNYGSGFNGNVLVEKVDANNKIIVGGIFSTYNGTSVGGIARLNSDGTLDTTFNNGGAGITIYQEVISILLQSDGKIIIVGTFTSYNGVSAHYIARLNSDGTLDTTFNSGGSGANIYGISNIAFQSNGQIIITGDFTAYNGTSVGHIARLNSNGTLDTTFNSGGVGANGAPLTLAVQLDDKILIASNFNIYDGITISSFSSNAFIRLNSDGTLDNTFNSLGNVQSGTYVYAIAIQSDGKILIGGNFSTYNGTSVGGIARLNYDSTLDTTFNNGGTGANSTVSTIAVQSDGRIFIGGDFTTYNSTSSVRFTRLNSDGTLNIINTGGTGADSTVSTIAVQSDGKILIGGNFTTYNGTTVNHIVRLFSYDTSDFQAIITTTYLNYGSHTLYFKATDSLGNYTTTYPSVNFTVASMTDTSAPTVSLTAPADNIRTSSNSVTLSATASDDVLVTGIQFQVDGVNVGAVGTTSPYSISWNTTSVSDGPHTITAIAHDAVPNYTTSTARTVVIDKTPPTITLIGQSTVYLSVGDTYTDAGATASDPIYGDVTSSIVTTNTVNTGVAGTYNVTYNVNDLAGNSATPVIRTVNVYNSSGPSFSSINVTQGTNTLTATGTASDASHSITSVGYQFNHTNSSWTNMTLNSTSSGTAGVKDTTFNIGGVGPNYTVSAMALQSDGKILIGGGFATYNSTPVVGIVRLNSNGTLDTTFNSGGTGADNDIASIVIQSDGKILIGGYFFNYNGTPVVGIARLNSDGTLDTTFNSGGDGADNDIDSIAIQSDGKILVGGGFLNYNGTYTGGVTRLNSDGTLDTTFNTGGDGADSSVDSIVIQSDGKILIGGYFYNYNDIPVVGIVRLNSDGTLDTTFNSGGDGADNDIDSIAIQSDGKILVGGGFLNYNGTYTGGVTRLNSDGTLDTTFNTGGVGPAGGVYSIAIQSDGKILIGGGFATYNTITVGKIALLNSDGTLDTTFNTGGAGFYTTNSVYSIVTQSDGNVLIGGLLSKYNGVNITTHCLIRFIGSVSNDKTFSQTISTTGLTAGPNTAYFLITDSAYNSNAGNYYSYNFTLPDVTAPTVSVTVPTDGTHFSLTSLDLTSISSDDVGVASVQFELDGNPVGSAGTTSPYSITLDTSHIAHGSHTIDAVARDTSGNATTSSLINVINDSYPVVPEGGSPLVSYIPPTSSTTIPETTNQTPITTTPIITSPIITSPITTPIAICLPGQAYNSMTGQACNTTTTITTQTPTYTFTKPLKLKDDIKHLQIVLNYTLNLNLKVDGISGRNTINAIKAFQKAHNLTPDGVVGPKTRSVLNGVRG